MRLSGPREWDLQLSADGSAAGLSQPPPTPEGGGGGGEGGRSWSCMRFSPCYRVKCGLLVAWKKKQYLQKLERKLLLIRTRTVCRVVGSGALK